MTDIALAISHSFCIRDARTELSDCSVLYTELFVPA